MLVEEEDRPLYVSVGYDEENDTLYMITVHWLDPEKWDDPWTRREKKEITSS